MKQAFRITKIIMICLLLITEAKAQKIEYQFKKDSDVNDSIKYVISIFKKSNKEMDIKKLNLFASIDYCDGFLNLYISNHSGEKSDAIAKLTKKTNRFILIDDNIRLPLIFETDILSKELFVNNPVFIRLKETKSRFGELNK
jgi:hypothetical protein